ncbi:sulfotransferase family 2 domain-containing protein [Microbaculum sp. FT89]|uniref:sulfotransferase family protein n=1 Tax=Microbaculum sp. FT89 TaxID=3447298 RepID=UPI003F52AEFA
MRKYGYFFHPIVGESFCYSPTLNFLYLNNAKSGCSTIKSALVPEVIKRERLTFPDPLPAAYLHSGRFWSRSYQGISENRPFTFSVVRNPFARILSAYLDKICKQGILRNKHFIQNDIPLDANISFVDFLESLDPNTSVFDRHWRRQVDNLFVGQIDIDKIYYLENFDETADDLAGALSVKPRFQKRAPHATGASGEFKRHYNDRAIELVLDLYAADFEIFGYSKNIDDAMHAPKSTISCPAETESGYVSLTLLALSLMPENKNTLLELAKTSELDFVDKALVANKAPNSPFGDAFDAELDARLPGGSAFEKLVGFAFKATRARRRKQLGTEADCLREVVRLAPYLARNRSRLARCLEEQGRHDEALEILDQLKRTTWREDLIQQAEDTVLAAHSGRNGDRSSAPKALR